ncbi:ABC transporter ATP-binding protein [Halosimplex rubrum]|uniref:Molybdate/tungstate import ATP-binding protein WtpC n=1 Tax=Halosimplex rubrum TaxID=869889 RepID=A0A7D5T5I8_9EURY|nr:ABC transporter ATP-binding protein [Halosimplex rubrum]QLH78550.1 ABC transporter ATP-binding protein [Halosimplex rubrum]
MADLELDGVRKAFDDTVALDDVTLDIDEGEFFTLVGPSGCGKTTTLRTIAGLESPTAGTVRFGGEDVAGVPTEDRDVGIVFQNYALFPHMSVRENVAYGLQFADPPDGQSTDGRVSELLDLVDLSGMGDREPDQLSGGQQQRVALARALAPAPDVLLLDEPMSALDARLRETLRRQVKRIQTDLGVTTVYVTHDQAEALAISDRLAVMSDGGVEQVGTPREVYERPATEFVASFVGENNLFRGEVVGREAEATAVSVDGTEFRVDAAEVSGRDATAGDRLTFCVRPEDLTVDADANRFEVAVDTAEFLGETTRYYADWGDRTVVFRTPDAHDGDALALGFDPGDARVL